MSATIFRFFILGSVASAILGVGLSFMLESTLPAELQSYIKTVDEADISAREIVLLLLSLPFVPVSIWATIGLYRFKLRGRTVSLWLYILSLPLCPLFGVSIVTGWEESFMNLSATLWGAAMAAAYLSPLKEQFESTTKTS